VIELFAVGPDEDDAFLAAYAAEAPPGHALYRALRAGVRYRFASVTGPRQDGALLIVELDPRALDAWERAIHAFTPRQGFLGAELHDGPVAVVRWSSPLMYARAISALGDVVAKLPFPAYAALYGRV